MTPAIMVLIVVTTIAWRGNALDPAAATSIGIDHIPYASRSICEVAKKLIILDAQRHQWEASATCTDSGDPHK